MIKRLTQYGANGTELTTEVDVPEGHDYLWNERTGQVLIFRPEEFEEFRAELTGRGWAEPLHEYDKIRRNRKKRGDQR